MTTTTTAPPPPPVARGTHVIFTTNDGSATHQIAMMRADGSERTTLTADPAHEHNWPRPSPDGTRIVFYRADPGQTANDLETNALWVMNSDGSDQREIIARGAHGWTRQGHVEWSPDGARLLMTAGSDDLQLWTTDPDGGSLRQITARTNVAGGYASVIDPSWAPDGRSIVYVGCPREVIMCWWWSFEVFRLDLTTGVETRLTFDDAPDFDPYISPDGSTLVWLRCSGSFPFGPWGLYRRSLAGSPAAEPVIDDGQINSNAMFASDGRTLVFTRHVIGGSPNMTVNRIGVDGSGLSAIANGSSTADEAAAVYWP